ncbi:hypothetical protein PLICRDRAFT_47208 [Plicaturopsis crispa FD-325 SS-3]|uniref:F-box domain-containing protein n=1 Tax=Plicaturopsis crispa FD-325 SS-3 TaxID=944288 RepID=A0A0C9T5F9_PLICR|nr:hypothetical protein PLICRDRAFT_47208 [Plicaturopsis crispa FD-325 SS-3]
MKRRSCRTRASPSTATAGLAKADDAGTCVQDAEPATRPRKRTKTTQEVTRMVEQEQTELEELHVERADFMELPLEIVFEVLGHMRPQELLLLARMSKPLRDILMHRRTGASIWKAAFANCPDIPACPPDLNGPQYANLLFCNLCHICLGPNPKTFWRLRVRYCSHCTYEKATDENEVPSVGSAYVMSEWYGRGRALVGIPGYAVGDLSLFKSILPALTKEGKRRALLKDVNARLNRIDKHAWACKEWTRKQREKRSRELARIRHRRLAE